MNARFEIVFAFIFLFFSTVGFVRAEVTDPSVGIALISDSHLGFKKSNEAFENFLSDVQKLPISIKYVINNGDITETGNVDLFDLYESKLGSLHVENLSVIGNHDTRWNEEGKRAYVEHIGPRYFSKDFLGIHWMFLDSTIEHQTQGHVDFRELQWIKKDLTTIPKDEPILVFSHHPFKWRGVSVDNGLDGIDLFEGHPPAAFFNGHGHKLERISFRGIPFIENDALFHDQYLVMTKSGNKMTLYQKKIGDTSLIPWFEFDLTQAPSASRIVFPKNNAMIPKNVIVQVRATGDSDLGIEVDRGEKIELQGKSGLLKQEVPVTQSGWHRIRLYNTNNPIPEDELNVFVPGALKTFPLGEIYAGLSTNGKLVFAGTLGGNFFGLNHLGRIQWQKELDGGVLVQPVFSNGSLFVATKGGSLYALSVITGDEKWRFKRDFPFAAAPVISGDTLFVGCGDKNVYAVDVQTGKEKWHTPLGAYTEAQPVVADGKVYVGAWDHTFYALNSEDGKVLWKANIGKSVYFSPAETRPVIVGDLVVVAGKDHVVYAFDRESGEEKWKVQVDDGFANPILYHQQLIVAETGGNVKSLDLETGKVVWEKKFDTSFYNASPVAFNGHLYLVGVEGDFIDYDLTTKEIASEFKLSRGFNFSTPVVMGNRLWAGSLDGNLYALPLPPASTK